MHGPVGFILKSGPKLDAQKVVLLDWKCGNITYVTTLPLCCVCWPVASHGALLHGAGCADFVAARGALRVCVQCTTSHPRNTFTANQCCVVCRRCQLCETATFISKMCNVWCVVYALCVAHMLYAQAVGFSVVRWFWMSMGSGRLSTIVTHNVLIYARSCVCAYAHVHNTQMGKLLNNNIMHISTRTAAAAAAATAVIVFVRLPVTDYIHIMFGYYVGSQLTHTLTPMQSCLITNRSHWGHASSCCVHGKSPRSFKL